MLPVQLQRLVIQLEQVLVPQFGLAARGLFRCRNSGFFINWFVCPRAKWLTLGMQFDVLDFRLWVAAVKGVEVERRLVIGLVDWLGRYRCRRRSRPHRWRQRLRFDAQAGRWLAQLVLQQGFGPALVMRVALNRFGRQKIFGVFRCAINRQELLGQLLLLGFELGQLFVQIEAVKVQVVMNPQRIGCFAAGRRGMCCRGCAGCGRLRCWWRKRFAGLWCRRWRGGRHCGWWQLLALFTKLLRSIKHMQAGPAAHGTMGGAQLREVHAKAGAAMGALGDKALGHAAIRLNEAASLTQVLGNAAAVRAGAVSGVHH